MILLTAIRYDALPLEYKLEEWRASRDYHVFNAVDDPISQSICRVFGLGLSEEAVDVIAFQRRLLTDYTSNSPVLAANRD